MKPCPDFFNFALFVAFFAACRRAHRASNLLPEIQAPRQITWENLGRGSVLCLTGLIKKVVIADAIAPSVDAVYGAPDPTGAAVLAATMLFAVQIYCDFSGYTDIARGVAKMLGFGLMRNFAQPYFATNPQEFWHRWHISLSTWLRDYLYISLGGNKRGRVRTYLNLMATMVLGGLWHGAAWNFVLWGIYQVELVVLHTAFFGRHTVSKEGAGSGAFGIAGRLLGIAVFFQVVCVWMVAVSGKIV